MFQNGIKIKFKKFFFSLVNLTGKLMVEKMRRKIFFILFLTTLILSESVEIKITSENQKNTEQVIIQRFLDYLRIKTAHPDIDYSKTVSFLRTQATRIGLEFQVKEVKKKKKKKFNISSSLKINQL